MKRFLKSKLALSLVVMFLMVGVIFGSLAGNLFRAHAQAPAPTVTLSSTSAPAGIPVTGTGTGWVAGSPITVLVDEHVILTFTPTSSSWKQIVATPSSATNGTHQFDFEQGKPDTTLAVEVPFTVKPLPVTKGESTGCDLKALKCTIILDHETTQLLASAIASFTMVPGISVIIQGGITSVCTAIALRLVHPIAITAGALACFVLLNLALINIKSGISGALFANDKGNGVSITISLSAALIPISFTVKPR